MSWNDCLEGRWGDPWLVGADHAAFWTALGQLRSQLQPDQRRLLAQPDPVQFLAAFWAAATTAGSLYVGNPDWGEREWQQALAIVQPEQVLGVAPDPGLPGPSDRGGVVATLLGIPTGGTSGQLRFALHTPATLSASVAGFQQHFEVGPVDAYCVLPLHHVSGLMQALRTFLSGGRLTIQPFKALAAGQPLPVLPGSFLSLVPTQLQRLLDQQAAAWLRQFRAVLLGGAPAWPTLLEQAYAAGIPLAPSYGMTETASQVATLLPEEFLGGRHSGSSGRRLPHVQLQVVDPAGQPALPGTVGQIGVGGSSLSLGYCPSADSSTTLRESSPLLLTGDLGYLDEQGHLYVVGRSGSQIITGGEKVFPEEIEAVLRQSDLVADICVIGMADPDWGQVVTTLYVPSPTAAGGASELAQLQQMVATQLSPYKRPKRWVAVPNLPRNCQGKLDRAAAAALAKALT